MTHEEKIEAFKQKPGYFGVAGIPRYIVDAMWTDYRRLKSLAKVGKIWNRSEGVISEVLAKHGLRERDHKYSRLASIRPKNANGCFAPLVPKTEEEISGIISRMTKIKIPTELYAEWRKWSLEKRGQFIERVRAQLNCPENRPSTPFSNNVEPFDYASRKAHEMIAALNAGTDSRTAKCKMDLTSQGVIFRGELWFWTYDSYVKRGPWTPENGRPVLHRVLWEEVNGRKLGEGDIIVFKDGNKNNLMPENLQLVSRNDICRKNQAAALIKAARAKTALLLNRSQQKKTHEHHKLIRHLGTPRHASVRKSAA